MTKVNSYNQNKSSAPFLQHRMYSVVNFFSKIEIIIFCFVVAIKCKMQNCRALGAAQDI